MLEIQPQTPSKALSQQFTLIGTVDAEAITVLEALYVVPDFGSVELDFAQVERIDTVGLAQLLKLFKHWRKKCISISAINTSYMVNVLFNVTGLNRFFTESIGHIDGVSNHVVQLNDETRNSKVECDKE